MLENLKDKRDEIVAFGVALSAFAASAQHIYHVTEAAGNPAFVAALHPAGIDGLIYIGIRAMQQGRRVAGGLAVAYGAVYSLTFNGFSYADGAHMPVPLLAACMPLAMFLAFLIVHSGHKAPAVPEVVTETVERIVEVVKAPALLPIVPFIPAAAPVRPALPIKVATTSARVAKWDVEKAVAMMLAGQTDAEILDVVDGLQPKTLQRTRRCYTMLAAGASPEDVSAAIPLSLAHVLRVRDAMTPDAS